MTTRLEEKDGGFDVTVLGPRTPRRSLVFAAGRGGCPGRHAGLLQAFADQGFRVVAPHFDRLETPVPTREALEDRARRIVAAVARLCPPGAPLCGAGHSLGATLLLALAGATAMTLGGETLALRAPRAFRRLALFAPPTDFFRGPGALAAVTVPIQLWAGGRDRVTPPAQARFLAEALRPRVPVDLRLIAAAGHFSFMDDLPPNVADPHPDRPAFLRDLAGEAGRFLAS